MFEQIYVFQCSSKVYIMHLFT